MKLFSYIGLLPLVLGQNTKFGRINCSLSHLHAYNVCTVPGKRGNDAERNPVDFHFTLHLQVDLRLKEKDGGDISSFISNGEWDLIGD